MRTVTILVALLVTINLSGQGIENSLSYSAGSEKDLIIFTYYRQILPDLESVTLLSNGKVLYATYYNRLKKTTLHSVTSLVKRAAEFPIRFAFDKGFVRDKDEKEIIIPVKVSGGQRLYLFPERRIMIAFTERSHPIPRIKPIFITGSRLSVWLRITI